MEQRKLREESDTDVIEKETELAQMPRPKIIRTTDGSQVQVEPEGFDFKLLDTFLPYHEGDELPPAVIKTNKKGIRFLQKRGDPRFFFQGNEFIQVYRGLGGKKQRLFWMYRDKLPTGQPNTLHRRIRQMLRKKGIPGA